MKNNLNENGKNSIVKYRTNTNNSARNGWTSFHETVYVKITNTVVKFHKIILEILKTDFDNQGNFIKPGVFQSFS